MYLNNLLKENTHKQDSIVEAEPGLKGGTTTTPSAPSGIITPVDMNTKPQSAWDKVKQKVAGKIKTPKNAPIPGTSAGSVFNTSRVDTPNKPKVDVDNIIDQAKAQTKPTMMQRIRPFTRGLGGAIGVASGLDAIDQAKQGETLNAIGSGAIAAGGAAAAINPNKFGFGAIGAGLAVDQGIKTYQALDKYASSQDTRDLIDAGRHAVSAFGYNSKNWPFAILTLIGLDPAYDDVRMKVLDYVGAEKAADWLKKNQPSDSVMKEALEFKNWADEMTATVLESVVTEAQFDEAAGEKDACYHKVKSRYKVWPSAYASGALVQCRKKGAKNWGNSKKK